MVQPCWFMVTSAATAVTLTTGRRSREVVGMGGCWRAPRVRIGLRLVGFTCPFGSCVLSCVVFARPCSSPKSCLRLVVWFILLNLIFFACLFLCFGRFIFVSWCGGLARLPELTGCWFLWEVLEDVEGGWFLLISCLLIKEKCGRCRLAFFIRLRKGGSIRLKAS